MPDPTLDEQVIFHAARRVGDPEGRRRYLDQACGSDLATRGRVEALLRVLDSERGFLESPALAAESAGSVIGSYTLRKLLGEGGMGSVYLAEQSQPVRRLVALKIIKPGMDSRQVLARFEAERQALALMDHPNIAKVFDAGTTPYGRPYFVMELVDGVSITRYCDERRLNPRQRLELFLPVCHAVQHAHQKGVIHRDLKPSNVLVADVDARPLPKVIDFGVAKAAGAHLTDESLETAIGTIIGTLEYMSPEQAEPGQLDIDTRTDVYSLGVVLYELLTGTTPLERKRLKQAAWLEMLRVVREEEPPKPSTRLSTVEELPSIAANRGVEPRKLSNLVRGDLDWIVMKSLEKDRTRRYATATGLAHDIERFLNEEPVSACPPSFGYRLRKFARRHRVGLVAIAACVALLVAGVVVSSWQAIRATEAERKARDNEATALAALERADQDAAIARAVNAFLQRDLLGQADIANQPPGERNRNITVRTVLDRASESIGTRFGGQGTTEAAIRMTLGKAYGGLGEYPIAQDHVTKALELRKQQLGETHAETLNCLSALGTIMVWRGRFAEAESAFKEVFAVREARHGPDHPSTINALFDLGRCYAAAGKPDWAEPRLGRVLEYRLANYGEQHEDTLEALRALGQFHLERRVYDVAESYLRRALPGFQRLYGPDHPWTLVVAGNLAATLREQRRHREAEPLMNEVYRACNDRHGPDHPSTLRARFMLGNLYLDLERWKEAAEAFGDIVPRSRARLGPDHVETISAMGNLGVADTVLGRFREAEALFDEVLAARRAANPPDEAAVINALNCLAILYIDCRRFADADRILVDAVATARERLTLANIITQVVVGNLALLRIHQGQPALAEPLLRELSEFKQLYGMQNSWQHGMCLSWLAHSLLDQSKFAEAEATARQSVTLLEKTENDKSARFESQSIIGAALVGQGKSGEAESWLVQGADGMLRERVRLPVGERSQLRAVLTRVVRFYDAAGKPEAAEKYRQELTKLNP